VVSREEADEILADCWHMHEDAQESVPKKGRDYRPATARRFALVLSRRAGRRDEVHGPGGCEGEATLAMTEVAKLIFDRLDYALAEKVMVRIEGARDLGRPNPCRPGRRCGPGWRGWCGCPATIRWPVLQTDCEALGIDCSYGSNPVPVERAVEYVIQHGGLFLVLDEAHFLAPMNFTETTSPHRLNWVRTEIVDRHFPLAISVTPQAFKSGHCSLREEDRYDMTSFSESEFFALRAAEC